MTTESDNLPTESGKRRLALPYERTVLVDFDRLMEVTRYSGSCEVRSTGGEYGVYPHKPLRNQGRFGTCRE
jgi:hypothetical protein